jgi:hypothetical protein
MTYYSARLNGTVVAAFHLTDRPSDIGRPLKSNFGGSGVSKTLAVSRRLGEGSLPFHSRTFLRPFGAVVQRVKPR